MGFTRGKHVASRINTGITFYTPPYLNHPDLPFGETTETTL